MAVSQIEEKILGRLSKQTASTNALLSASLYQVLGLSILLSRKLYRARKLRKLDNSRDTKSLQLYHHIIWLAREGLSITEVYILPYCQDGEQGPECRVMAAKLRASLYHVFCLFHNHPPVSQLSGQSYGSPGTNSSENTPKAVKDSKTSPKRSPKQEKGSSDGSRRNGKPALRDPISSMTSDASFLTNPYATGAARTPPPPGLAIIGGPGDVRRTPSRPPGLAPINVPATQAAASWLLPPLNFVPMAREYFDTAQQLAYSFLPATHALRLSVSLEYTAFLWDCAKDHDRARKLARRSIRDVYASSDGLDDDEFADASALVQALGGIVRRGSNDSTPQQPPSTSPTQRASSTRHRPKIDRTIAVSPGENRGARTNNHQQQQTSYYHQPPPQIQQIPRSQIPRAMQTHHHQQQQRIQTGTPERLSTVPEEEPSLSRAPTTTNSPPTSRSSTRPRRASSVTSQASDKASKRKLVEQAEERARSRQGSASSQGGAGQHSRQATPAEGYVRKKTPSPPSHTKNGRSGGANGHTSTNKKGRR